MTRVSLATAAALLMLATPAWAQYGGGAASTEPAAGGGVPKPGQADSAVPANGFEKLPAGDRKIARALFMAQRPTRRGPAPLSLNQIAELKGRGSWAAVFNQMQARGLIQAKNLGQVVNNYERQQRSELYPRGGDDGGRSTTLVTSGSGAVVASSRRAGAGMAHGGDVTGETQSTVDIAAANRPFRDRPQRR